MSKEIQVEIVEDCDSIQKKIEKNKALNAKKVKATPVHNSEWQGLASTVSELRKKIKTKEIHIKIAQADVKIFKVQLKKLEDILDHLAPKPVDTEVQK